MGHSDVRVEVVSWYQALIANLTFWSRLLHCIPLPPHLVEVGGLRLNLGLGCDRLLRKHMEPTV